MTKLIDRIMPYKVVAESTTMPFDKKYDLKIKGFTKRFTKEKRLENYLKRKINKGIFDEEYFQADNTYYVSPGSLSILKANFGI